METTRTLTKTKKTAAIALTLVATLSLGPAQIAGASTSHPTRHPTRHSIKHPVKPPVKPPVTTTTPPAPIATTPPAPIATTPPAPIATTPPAPVTTDLSSAEQFLALTNQARAAAGLSSLRIDTNVSAYALTHSQQMASQKTLFHTTDWLTALSGATWRVAGENVGAGDTLAHIQTAFLNSSSHLANILNRNFTRVGIGVYTDANATWITVLFYG